MTMSSWRPAAIRGFLWGVLAGLALVALMYLAGSFLGLRPLPQALSGPLLAIMPGFVFGFLIDTLQHAGKVVEEFGLIVAMVVGLGVLGAAWAVASGRWRLAQSALVFAGVGWLLVTALLLPISGVGFLGLNDGPTTPLVWGLLFANFFVVSKNFSYAVVAAQGWSLSVGGAVDKPLKLSLADLRALPSSTEYVTMECISNNVGGELMSTGGFSGVRLRDLLAIANPRANGTWAA